MNIFKYGLANFEVWLKRVAKESLEKRGGMWIFDLFGVGKHSNWAAHSTAFKRKGGTLPIVHQWIAKSNDPKELVEKNGQHLPLFTSTHEKRCNGSPENQLNFAKCPPIELQRSNSPKNLGKKRTAFLPVSHRKFEEVDLTQRFIQNNRLKFASCPPVRVQKSIIPQIS